MPSPGYTRNPEFDHIIRRAKALAVTEKATEAASYAASNASWSQSIPPNIVVDPATTMSPTAVVRLSQEGFRGFFFEKGTKMRRTRSGAARGRGPRWPFMKPARDRALLTPLPIHKYL